MSHLAYVLVSVLICFAIALRHDRRLLSFLILFWIMTEPVMTSRFPLAIPGLPFMLTLNRILLLVLLAYLLPVILSTGQSAGFGDERSRQKNPPFITWFYLLSMSMMVSLLYNFGQMHPKDIFITISDLALFLLFFTYAKLNMDGDSRRGVMLCILYTAVMTLLVAVIQIWVSTDFLRATDPRTAFAELARTTGIFYNEYDLSYFMILSIFVSLTCIDNRIIRLILVGLFGFCVLITFHRMSYIVLLFSTVIYLKKFKKFGKLSLVAAGAILAVLGTLAIASFAPDTMSMLSKSNRKDIQASFQERLANDTVTGRFRQWGIAVEYSLEHPLGIGYWYDNPDYFRLMSKHWMVGGSYQKGYYPLAIHNGFLFVSVIYGILSMVLFIAFCFSALRYYSKRFRLEDPPSVLPYLGMLIFTCANISNPFSDFSSYFILLVALLAGGALNNAKPTDASVPA